MIKVKRYSKVIVFFLATFSFVGMQAGEESSFVARFEKIVKDLKRSHGDANREDLKKAYSYQPETACEEDCRQLIQDLHEDGKNLDWLVQAWLDAKLERVWDAFFYYSYLEPEIMQRITKDKFFWLFSNDSFNHSVSGSYKPTISTSFLDKLACFLTRSSYSEIEKSYLDLIESLHFGFPTNVSLDSYSLGSFLFGSYAVLKDRKFEINVKDLFEVALLHEAIHCSKLHTLKKIRFLRNLFGISERQAKLLAYEYLNSNKINWFQKLQRFFEYEADILAYKFVSIDKLHQAYELFGDDLDSKLKSTHPRSISRISLSVVMYKLRNAEQVYLALASLFKKHMEVI